MDGCFEKVTVKLRSRGRIGVNSVKMEEIVFLAEVRHTICKNLESGNSMDL